MTPFGSIDMWPGSRDHSLKWLKLRHTEILESGSYLVFHTDVCEDGKNGEEDC